MTLNQLREALECNKAYLKCADHQPILEDAARLIALPILERNEAFISAVLATLAAVDAK